MDKIQLADFAPLKIIANQILPINRALCELMIKPEKLIFDGEIVAILHDFHYETPWCYASPTFSIDALESKLKKLSEFRSFDLELEDMGLEEAEEEYLWEQKLSSLGLTHADLKLDKDGCWKVTDGNGRVTSVYSLSYSGGVIQWRQ